MYASNYCPVCAAHINITEVMYIHVLQSSVLFPYGVAKAAMVQMTNSLALGNVYTYISYQDSKNNLVFSLCMSGFEFSSLTQKTL